MSVAKPNFAYYSSLSAPETALKLVREMREQGEAVHGATVGFDGSVGERQNKYAVLAGALLVTEPVVERAEERWMAFQASQAAVDGSAPPIRHAKRELTTAVQTNRLVFDFLESEEKLSHGERALAARILRVGRSVYRSSVFIDGQIAGLVGAPRIQSLTSTYNAWRENVTSLPTERLRALREKVYDTEKFVTILAPGLSAENVQTASDIMSELNDLYDDVE